MKEIGEHLATISYSVKKLLQNLYCLDEGGEPDA
jgi:hypothetical protein